MNEQLNLMLNDINSRMKTREKVQSREDYYSRSYILFEMVKILKNRYLSVRKLKDDKYILSRYFLGYSLELFKDSMARNNVTKDASAKMYYDLAIYKNEKGFTPLFSFNRDKRKEEKKVFSGRGQEGAYLDYLKGYDFAIDIDSKNLKVAWKEAKKIKDVFDEYKLPYSIRFSGSKGFHFTIDQRFIEIKDKYEDHPSLFGKVVNNLVCDEFGKDKEGNPKGHVDFSIYDLRRILKLPYSICNNNGSEYVVLPLTNEEFINWKYEDMLMESVMKNKKIKDRGILERTFNLSDAELSNNFTEFIGDYSDG